MKVIGGADGGGDAKEKVGPVAAEAGGIDGGVGGGRGGTGGLGGGGDGRGTAGGSGGGDGGSGLRNTSRPTRVEAMVAEATEPQQEEGAHTEAQACTNNCDRRESHTPPA